MGITVYFPGIFVLGLAIIIFPLQYDSEPAETSDSEELVKICTSTISKYSLKFQVASCPTRMCAAVE